MAAEAVSLTFLQCLLKGLQRSLRIVSSPRIASLPGVLTAANVSCLIVPILWGFGAWLFEWYK